MTINRLAGSPWHKEQVHRQEGDDRRYKGRCKYYEYDGNKCLYRCGSCIGSAHCKYYQAISELEFKRKQKASNLKKQSTANKTLQKNAPINSSSSGIDDDVYWY